MLIVVIGTLAALALAVCLGTIVSGMNAVFASNTGGVVTNHRLRSWRLRISAARIDITNFTSGISNI